MRGLRVDMRQEIRRAQQQLGITTLYVTHDQVEAMSISDRVVVMNQGKIEQIGTPERYLRGAGNGICRRFYGVRQSLQGGASNR